MTWLCRGSCEAQAGFVNTQEQNDYTWVCYSHSTEAVHQQAQGSLGASMIAGQVLPLSCTTG